ncbi:MAG: isochorismate synthase [Cyclobacteriaceae bacterium]
MKEKVLLDDYFNSLSTSLKIAAFYRCAVKAGFPVAIWSLPSSDQFHVIISMDKNAEKGKVELEKLPPGFLFSPFDNEEGHENYFLHADVYYNTASDLININPILSSAKRTLADELIESLSEPIPENIISNKTAISFNQSFDYVNLVKDGIKAIRNGEYDKLVLSRNKKIQLPDDFDPIDTLIELRKAYQNAFCYLLSTNEYGNWIAATPEVLITLDEETFDTIALAGTARLDEDQRLTDVSWTQKEIEEQAMVSRYIINSFKRIRLREFKETGPRTVKAGNLAHLKTTFSVKYKEINFPELGTVMLDLLHPTSAVCGMPLTTARNFIKTNEGFDRSLFSGYMGPVNIEECTSLFVNLRTMRFNDSEGVLYAGAGITEDSDPEKEFIETELKMQTLLNIIDK